MGFFLDARLHLERNLEISELTKLISVGSQKMLCQRIQDRLSNVDVAEYCDFILAPLLRRIGESTRAGVMSVGYEHLASNAIKAALLGYRSQLSKGKSLNVLVCTLEGNSHDLPCAMLKAVCEFLGVNCFNAGASTPASSIIELLRDLEVGCLAISFSYKAKEEDFLARECRYLLDHLPIHVKFLFGGDMADSVPSLLHSRGSMLNNQVAFKTRILDYSAVS